MSDIYDEMRGVVAGIMPEFKQGVIQLVSVTPGNGPVDQPGTPTESTTTLDATAKGVAFKYVQQGLAVASDLMITAPVVAGITPDLRDFITIGGIRHKIVAMPHTPAGNPVAWKFIVRKGK